MSTPDFVRARLTEMIDLRHPMAVLAGRLHLAATEAVIEAAVAPKRVPAARPAQPLSAQDLLGPFAQEFGGGVSPAGRPRLPIRLMPSLTYRKNSFNFSDEELVERWSENVQWQG